MFVGRLDDARQCIASEAKKDVRYNSNSDSKNSQNGRDSKAAVLDTEKSDIILKFSEYIFDIFDANCMADFKKMEAFEKRAIAEFRNYNVKEFTHKQHQLHEEFMTLFETLIEGFLMEEKYSIDTFYAELQQCLKKSVSKPNQKSLSKRQSKSDESDDDEGDDTDHASEIVEVVNSYMNFEVWAQIMYDQAKQQDDWKKEKEKKTLIDDSNKSQFQIVLYNAMTNDRDMLCGLCTRFDGMGKKHRLDC